MNPYLIMSIATIATALVGLVGAWLTYRLGKRTNSGTIATSSAQNLWDASEAFREMLSKDVAELRSRLDQSELERAKLGARILELEQVESHKDARIAHLEAENTILKARVQELEKRVAPPSPPAA